MGGVEIKNQEKKEDLITFKPYQNAKKVILALWDIAIIHFDINADLGSIGAENSIIVTYPKFEANKELDYIILFNAKKVPDNFVGQDS